MEKLPPNGPQTPDSLGQNHEKRLSSEEAQRIFDFILKLASDAELPDVEITEGIVDNLRKLRSAKDFPSMFNRLDPNSYSPETKSMSDEQKQRLSFALDQL